MLPKVIGSLPEGLRMPNRMSANDYAVILTGIPRLYKRRYIGRATASEPFPPS